jgi:hypothetical protein
MNSKKRYLKLLLALVIIIVVCVVARMQNGPNSSLFSRDLLPRHEDKNEIKVGNAAGSVVTIELSADKTTGSDTPITLTAEVKSHVATGPLRFGWRLPQGVQVVSGDLTTQLTNLSPENPATLKITVILHTKEPLKILAYGVFNQGDAFMRTMSIINLNAPTLSKAATPKQ